MLHPPAAQLTNQAHVKPLVTSCGRCILGNGGQPCQPILDFSGPTVNLIGCCSSSYNLTKLRCINPSRKPKCVGWCDMVKSESSSFSADLGCEASVFLRGDVMQCQYGTIIKVLCIFLRRITLIRQVTLIKTPSSIVSHHG